MNVTGPFVNVIVVSVRNGDMGWCFFAGVLTNIAVDWLWLEWCVGCGDWADYVDVSGLFSDVVVVCLRGRHKAPC